MQNYKLKFKIIFLLIFSLFAFRFSLASAAVLYTGSAYEIVYEGQTFVVEWFLDTESTSVNSVALKLHYSTETLELVDAASGNSVISLWIANPQFSNEQGTAELIGGIPGGAVGNNLPIFRSVFRAKAAGRAKIGMDESSAILLNDGQGLPLPLKFQELDFTIAPKDFQAVAISSPTHPDPKKWYKVRKVMITFEPRPEEEYSYSFSSNLEMIPDDRPDEIAEQLEFKNLPDGLYYFKLNSRQGTAPWQEAGVFHVQIDTTPPEAFEPRIATDPAVFEGQPFLTVSAVDKASGILHYKIKSGLVSGVIETGSPYKLARPLLGNSVEVQAVDLAGNIRKAQVTYPGQINWPVIIALGIAAGLASLFILRLIKKRIKKQQSA